MEKQTYRFGNEIEKLEVKSLGAKIIIRPAEGNEITAEYCNPKDKPEFCAVLQGKTLTFKEKSIFDIIGGRPAEDYTLTVYLPVKNYAEISISTAAGGVDIDNIAEISAEKFDLKTASGDVGVKGNFDNIAIKTASGNVSISQEKTAKSLEICTVSGNVEVGVMSEKFSISSVSGTTKLLSASGEGKVSITSGNVDLDYSCWNGDLQISAVSGNAEIHLPKDSGIDVAFSGVSGSFKTDIGGEKGKLMNLGIGTDGHFGGDNSHKLAISLTSGTVKALLK